MFAKLLLSFGLLTILSAEAEYPYQIEDIPLPKNVPPEVGGLDFAPDGTLFVVLRRGDVFRAKSKSDDTDFDWQLFATGQKVQNTLFFYTANQRP